MAAVLSRTGKMQWPLAIGSCLAGVLLGDLVVYSLGFFYGERVLSLPLTRRLLTRQREAQIKGYFHRHGFKILVSGRFVPGFRTAAYLTAGILKLPPVKLLLTDLVAASFSTLFFFVLGYAFAYQIQQGIREVQQWALVLLAAGIVIWLLVRYYRASRRAGMPVGPPVLDSDEDALSIDDLPSVQSPSGVSRAAAAEQPGPLPPDDDGQQPGACDETTAAALPVRQAGQEFVNLDHDGPATDAEPPQHIARTAEELTTNN